MPDQAVPSGRVISVLAVMVLPAALVLGALAALGALTTGWAVVAVIAIAALLIPLVRRALGDLLAIRRYAETLAEGEAAEPPHLRHPGALPELAAAVERLRQFWERQHRELHDFATSTGTVLDGMPDPVLLLDSDRRVVKATRLARELFDTEPAGRDLASLIRRPAVTAAAERVLAGGPAEEVEFTLLVPSERTWLARLVPLPAPAPDGTVAAAVLLDLTETRRAEQTRADFAANASHELRTPLSVLVGCIKTLRGAAKDDAEGQARFLEMMDRQAERMTQLVEDLLSLSRIELDEHRPPAERVGLAPLIDQVADAVGFTAESHNVTLAIEGLDGLPPIQGDELQLGQLFQNLIDNAIKYGGDNGTVRVAGRLIEYGAPAPLPRERAAVAVAIEDHGPGIAPEHLPRLTERFYRVDTARSRALGGTGLGLAIVKHIVARHRGHLAIASEPGKGSVFTVTLPAAAPRPTAGRHQTATSAS